MLRAYSGSSAARRIVVAVWLVSATAACTRALFVPPVGPGEPAPTAQAAFAEAISGCRDARSFAAMLRVSGRVGSARVWPVSIETAVTADQSIYLSATAAGTSLFVVAGTANRATLWLRREQRVVTASPSELMDAIVGVPLSPSQLLATLTGCPSSSLEFKSAARYGALLSVETGDGRVFLEQTAGAWRTRFAQADRFTAEFRRKGGAVPSDVWIWSAAAQVPAATIHLSVADGEINGQIPASIFQIPAGASSATPLSLDELRSASPWKDRGPSPKGSAWLAR